jgi:glucosamine--fructose-6-phosphate aminotransferase (isomerizing)
MSEILRNIRQQPSVLATIADYLRCDGEAQLEKGAVLMRNSRRVVFVGIGGSRYAALPTALYLSQFGIDARVMDASEVLYYEHISADTAVILVSRSGRTAEMVRLAEHLDRDGNPYIAITNSPDSPMAVNADVTIQVAGETDSGISIRTYTGAVLTLLYLGAKMVNNLNILHEETIAMLSKLGTKIDDWDMDCSDLTSSRFFCFLGRGYSISCACEAALLFQELARRPAAWYIGAEFRQGPVEVLQPEDVVFVFAPHGPTRELNIALIRDLKITGARIFEIGSTWPELPEHLAAIPQIIPVQFAAYRLAVQNEGRPGDFRFAAETTEREHGITDAP